MIDTSFWINRNTWINSFGERVVREGLQKQTNVAFKAKGNFAGGFSLKNPRTGDVCHYVLITGEEACVCLLDEEFQIKQKYDLGKGFNPQGPFQGASLGNGQLLMGAPGMQMLWGFIGSGFKAAVKQESSLSLDFNTVSIPDGICVSWQGRVVIAARDALFFSDVLSPRAFLAANTHRTPGLVYFMKVSQAGQLFIGTSTGMYTVAADSVYSGEILQPIFQKVSEVPTHNFFKSAMTSLGPVTLSEKGIISTSSLQPNELLLGDPTMPRSIGEPNHYVNFKNAKILETKEGPLVVMTPDSRSFIDSATRNSSVLAVRVNEKQGFFSWWEPSKTRPTASQYTFSKFTNGFDFQGTLYDEDGREFVMTGDMILTSYGNLDEFASSPIDPDEEVEQEGSRGGAFVLGSIYGAMTIPPPGNPVVRYVVTASDNVGSYQYVAVRGTIKRSAPLPKNIPTCDDNIDWFDVAPSVATSRYYEKTLQSIKHNFSIRTQDPTIEIGVEGSGFRLGLSEVVSKGPGKFRYVDGKTYDYMPVSKV
jgi:hypothetical protein